MQANSWRQGALWAMSASEAACRSTCGCAALKVELREFQAEYFNAAATPTINVRINVKMVQMPQRTIIASQGFDTKRPAPSNRMSDIVQTFDAALGIVLRDVVIWTLRLS